MTAILLGVAPILTAAAGFGTAWVYRGSQLRHQAESHLADLRYLTRVLAEPVQPAIMRDGIHAPEVYRARAAYNTQRAAESRMER